MKPDRTCLRLGGGLGVCFFLILLQTHFSAFAQTKLDTETVGIFFKAIEENNTNTFLKMLAGDTNLVNTRFTTNTFLPLLTTDDTNLLNSRFSDHLPLHLAASLGRIEMVDALLKHGADINAQSDTFDTYGRRLTALEAAIWYNHPEVCKLLLAAGADLNILNAYDESAFDYIFGYQNSSNKAWLVSWLLDYGADPFLAKMNPTNKVTPLEMVITDGDGKLIARMLGQDSKHPLGNKSLVKSTLKKSSRQMAKTSAEFLAERGVTLLAEAAQRGELEAVQALFRAGVSAKGKAEDGRPLLQIVAVSVAAAAGGNNFETNRWLQIRDLLIKNGADYDVFAATAMGDLEQAQRLSSANKNLPQATDKDGQTPLHWAVQNNQLPMTTFWLQAGVSPAATNFAGQTALHIAAGKNLVEHMKLLLAANAPTGIPDTNGWTPMDAAEHSQNTEAIRLLLSNKSVAAPPDRAIATAVHEAAASGNLSALAALTESTNNLEVRNELGLTPLQVAVEHGHLAAAALLVDKGANVNVRDPDGNTLLIWLVPNFYPMFVRDRPPLNWLSARLGQNPHKEEFLKNLTVGQNEQGSPGITQTGTFLLICGIDINATNRAGKTAIQWAEDENTILYDRGEFLKLLNEAGGNINQRDAEGNTVLHRSVNGD